MALKYTKCPQNTQTSSTARSYKNIPKFGFLLETTPSGNPGLKEVRKLFL
jgi:hypothetical protein